MKPEDFIGHCLKLKDYDLSIFKYAGTNKIRCIRLFNSDGELEAPFDLPAEVEFTKSGFVEEASWYQSGGRDRKNGLPASISYFPDSEDIMGASWYIQKIKIRGGDMPSAIGFEQGTTRPSWIEFTGSDGNQYRSKGRHPFICFNEDGSMEDEDGIAIFVDEEDLPKNIFELPSLPSIIPTTRLQPNASQTTNQPKI